MLFRSRGTTVEELQRFDAKPPPPPPPRVVVPKQGPCGNNQPARSPLSIQPVRDPISALAFEINTPTESERGAIVRMNLDLAIVGSVSLSGSNQPAGDTVPTSSGQRVADDAQIVGQCLNYGLTMEDINSLPPLPSKQCSVCKVICGSY